MATNPLKVLGLDPALLRGLDENMARATVRAIARAQLQVNHPDQGGDVKRFQEVSAIQDELKDDAVFAEVLAKFLKSKKTQLQGLEEKNRKLQRLALHHERRAQAFALASLSPTLTTAYGAPFVVKLVDRVVSQMSADRFRPNPMMFVTLSVAADGSMQVNRNGKTSSTKRRLVGSIAGSENIVQIMRDSQPSRVDLLLSGGRSRTLGVTHHITNSAPIGANQVQVEHARPVLRRLRPDVLEGSYLFSAYPVGEQDYLYFEGKVSSIELGTESM